nr:PREDICTED: uncharacterized protein LOC103982061 [Musa acuminata subsp. malaccensis]
MLHCCGSKRFAREMAFACRFADVHHALRVARDIWFNKVDVAGWLEAVSAHLAIGATSPPSPSGARKSNPLRWLLPPIPSCRLSKSDAVSNTSVTTYCHVSSSTKPEGSSPRTRPPSWMLPVPLQPLAWRFTFEMWKGAQRHPLFTNREFTDWVLVDHENIVEASSLSPVQKLDGCVMILSGAKASVR